MCAAGQDTDDRKGKSLEEPEESWEAWESTVNEIYGDAKQRLETQPKATSEGETFYTKEGLALSNLSSAAADQPLLGASLDDSGRMVVRIYRNRQDAENGKPLLDQTFSYGSDNGRSIESRTIRTHGQQKHETRLETAFNSGNMQLSFQIEQNGQKQTITLDSESRPVQFKVKSGDRELEYKIVDGKLVGVTVNGAEVKGPQLAEFLQAGENSLRKLRKANGIPEPFSKEDSIGVAGDQLNKMAQPHATPEQIIKALTGFNQLAAEAQLDPKTIEALKEMGITRATRAAVDALASPESLKDPEKLKALKESLKLVLEQGSDVLKDLFGGKAGLDKLLKQLESPENAAEAVKSVGAALEQPYAKERLNDASALSSLPVSPKELLLGNLLTPAGIESIRNYGAVAAVREAARDLSEPDQKNYDKNVKALKQALETLKARAGSESGRYVTAAFGGSSGVDRLLASLGTTDGVKQALESIDKGVKQVDRERLLAPVNEGSTTEQRNLQLKLNLLITYSFMKGADEETRKGLAQSLVKTADETEAGREVLAQIITRDKGNADAELLKETRDNKYVDDLKALQQGLQHERMLPLLKKMASIESTSPAIKSALEAAAKEDAYTADFIAYARMYSAGGPDGALKSIKAIESPFERVRIWDIAAIDLRRQSEENGKLTPGQLTLAIEARLRRGLDGNEADGQDERTRQKNSFSRDQDRNFREQTQNKLDAVIKKAAAGGDADFVATKVKELLAETQKSGDLEVRDSSVKMYLSAMRGGMSNDLFAKHFDFLAEQAKKGDPTSIALMVAMTAGEADRYDEKGKTPIAERASDVLVSLATKHKGEKVMREVASAYELMVDRLITDNNRLMDTFAKLAGSFEMNDWMLHRLVRNQANNYASQPDSVQFKGAIKGLVTLGSENLWEKDDAVAMMNNFNPQIAEGVKTVFKHIEPECRKHILDRLNQIAANDTLPAEQRRLAQETFKAVEDYASDEQKKAMKEVQLPELDFTPPRANADTPPTSAQDLLNLFLRRDGSAITDADMARIKKLVEQIDSPNALERGNAAKQLAAYGPAIVPILSPMAKGAGQECGEQSNPARAIVRAAMETQLPLIGDRLDEFLKPESGKRPDSKKLEEAIKALDALAENPQLRAQRKDYLEGLVRLVKDSPDELKRAQQGLAELRNLDQMRAELRLRLAGEKITAGDKDGARQLLTKALEINPALVKPGSFSRGTQVFSQVYAAAGGGTDTVLSTAIQKSGGRAFDFVPRSTAALEGSSAKQSQNLKVGEVIERAKGVFSRFETAADPHMDPSARAARMAEIMRDPDPRSRQEVVGLALDQYKAARNDYERAQAMDALKVAVQNGNNYALEALRDLSTLDSAMRLSDSVDTLNSPIATKDQKAAAEQRRDEALMDLARHEYAERQGRGDEHVGDSGGVMEYLAKGAAPGITADQVAQARERVVKEVQVRQQQVAVAVQTYATATGPSRGEALAQLEKLALEQIGQQFNDDINRTAFQALKESDAIRYTLDNIDNPQKAAEGLLQLSLLRQKGFGGLDVSFGQLGEGGRALSDALWSGDRSTVERLVATKAVKDLIKDNFGPRDQLTYKLAALKTQDVLKALQDPEKLDELLQVAAKEAKANQQIVDGLVNDYLLRSTLAKPAMDALSKAIPAADKAFKLPDDKELRTKLESAVRLEHLPAAVAKHARTLLQGGELSAQDVIELRAELRKTDAERRRDSIARLNQMSFDHLHTTYKFESVVKALESLEQGQDTIRGVRAASKLFAPGSTASPEDKANAVQAVLKHFDKMKDMLVDHSVTGERLFELESKLGGGKAYVGSQKLDALMQDLKSGDDKRIAAALTALDNNMPDATAKLDEYRAARIVRVLGPDSKPEDYQRVSQQLTDEITASKTEGGQVNESAVDWSRWTRANEAVARISQAASENDSEKAKQAVADLVEQAKAGNPYARAAVAAVLVGDQEDAQIGQWMRNHPAMNGNRQIYVPNFRSLPAETRTEMLRAASAGLMDIGKTEKLTKEETSAMALALSKTADSKGDKQTIDNLTSALNAAIEGKSRTEALNGIFEAIESEVKGSKVLASIYLKGVNDPEFSQHFEKLQQFAGEYDKRLPNDRTEASLRIMAGIAAGMADQNRAVNPLQKVWRDGKDVLEEKDSIAGRARKTLEEAAQVSGARSTVVDALLEVHEKGKTDVRFRDNNRMLGALGVIASELDDDNKQQRDRALSEIRDVVKASTARPDSFTHRSAVEGFVALAKHWQQADLDVVKTTFTEAMFSELQANADKIPPKHRDEILAKMVENIKAGKDSIDFQTRLGSLRTLSAFGKYLNLDQVNLLSSFGGNERYNWANENVQTVLNQYQLNKDQSKIIQTAVGTKTDIAKAVSDALGPKATDQQRKELTEKVRAAVASTKPGLQILSELGITGPQAELFQARAAEGLLRTLASAPYDLEGKIGPREAAFKAFRDLPWPLPTGETVNGAPVIQKSHESTKLKDALVAYFEGKPILRAEDLELSNQINRIVDSAKLPPPAALIVRKMGIEGGPIEGRKEGDPESVLQITDKIVRNYTRPDRSGQDVLKDVVRNLDMVNALPGLRRAEIMGWTKLSPEQQSALGRTEPDEEKKKQVKWDTLSEREREAIRWQDALRIPSEMVAGQMALNELQNSPITKKLLEHVPGEVNKEIRATESAIGGERYQIRVWQHEKKKNLDEFVEKTQKGANFGNQLIGFFTFNNGIDAELSADQKRLAESFGRLTEQITKAEERVGRLEQDKGGMELSREVYKYTETLHRGDRVKADQMAVGMWSEHGPMLSQLAPGIWRDLTISTDTTLQGASLLKRLVDRNMAHWDTIPGYTSGDRGPGKPFDRAKSVQGFREALGLDPAFSTLPEPPSTSPGERRGLIQLKPGEKLLDTAALRTHMFARIDADPVLAKFSGQSRKMGDDLNELSKMFSAAMKGSVYDESINVMKEKAQRIKDALEGDRDNPITRQDLNDLADRIKTMEEALAAMRKNSAEHNQAAIDDLEKRIKTFKGMHNLFNRFEDTGWQNPRYTNVEGALDDKGNPVNQNKQINEMCKRILDGGLTAATFTNWCKENGVLIGVTIAACAATVAACATFGVSSPAAVGLWVAVVGLAAREVTNEVLFQVNRDGYTGWGNYDNKGAKIGNWNREAYAGKFKDVEDALKHLGTDVVGPYALEIVRDWAAFVLTAGIMNRVGGMGSGESVKALFRAAPPRNAAQLAFQSERMALLEAKAGFGPLAKSYLNQFMREFRRELLINSGMGMVQTGIETGLQKAVIGREGMEKMGEWGQFAMSFGLSTFLAMGQGALHSRIFRHGSFEPGAKFKFQLADGVSEAQMVKYMNQQGLNVKQIAPGRWEVLPVGAKPGMNPITMENEASRGQGRPPADLHPEGHTPQKQPRGALEETISHRDGEWKQTPEGQKILKEIGDFTEQFMKPNGEGLEAALKLATSADGLPVDRKIIPVDAGDPFDAKTYNGASPAERQKMLQDYMEQISGVGKLADGGLTAHYPQMVVKIDGHHFNLATGQHIGPTPPPEAVTAFNTFKNSTGGKRLLQEQAIHAMEERLHLLHQVMGNQAFSPSYIKFMNEKGELTSDHAAGNGRKDGSEAARASLERELILALYDKGWSRQMLEHHFGNHHTAARREALNWLREKEGVAAAAKQQEQVRIEVNKAIAELPEPTRTALKDLGIEAAHFNTADNVKVMAELVQKPVIKDCLEKAQGKTKDLLHENLRKLASDGELAARADFIDKVPMAVIERGLISPELMLSARLNVSHLESCLTATRHLANMSEIEYLKEFKTNAKDPVNSYDRMQVELADRLKTLSEAAKNPDVTDLAVRADGLEVANRVRSELLRCSDLTVRNGIENFAKKLETTLDCLEYHRRDGKIGGDRKVDLAQIAAIKQELAARSRDSFIPKEKFVELLNGMPEKQATIAKDVIEHSVSNMSRARLDQQLGSVVEQVRQAEGGHVKKITVVAFDEASAGEALGYLARCNAACDVEVKVLNPATMKDGLSPSNPILVLDPITAASRPQIEFLSQFNKIYTSDLNGFHRGPNLWDMAVAKTTGNSAIVTDKVQALTRQVESLMQSESLTRDQAMVRVMRQDSDAMANHPLLAGKVKVVNPELEFAAGKANRVDTRNNERAMDRLYEQLNKPTLDPVALDKLISSYPKPLQETIGLLLRDGVNCYGYPEMLGQMNQLHGKLKAHVEAKGRTTDDIVVVTRMESSGSANLVHHLYARASGLKPSQYIAADQIIANPSLIKGKTVVYLDDYVYSGRQSAKLIGEPKLAQAIRTADADVVVAHMGGYQMKVDPFAATGLKPTLIFGENLRPNFYESQALQALALVPDALRLIGGKSGYLKNFTDKVVEAGQIQPYRGPNNNIELVRIYLERVWRQQPTPKVEAPPAKEKSPVSLVDDTLRKGGSPSSQEDAARIVSETKAEVVIDLRGGRGAHDAEAAKIAAEKQWLSQTGSDTVKAPKHEHVPVPQELPMKGTAAYDDFLATLHKFETIVGNATTDGKKVYVHCEWGQDRTGMMLALHKMLSGVPADKAMSDWKASKPKGVDPDFNQLHKPEYLKQLLEDYRARYGK